ncbi:MULTISPECIES: hypothetical protein [Haloferax]|uniref:Uncharacterized protein n=1 Tax=Haloferax marinum TaxID=2666143 RepID=A0A6A8G6W2_9EURY|nr:MULTISPECIES: hypothetical protein [Haloferax]KAB1196844.1 hypothetical protein Hfx1150_04620 [Haloferax sp. CBA1150]MRW95856.1 hypothetical protein [Haloferax marinum]
MTDDPFSLSVPEGWSVAIDTDTDDANGRTVYESPDEDYRVVVTEFSRGLRLYWWVDIFAYAGGEWHRREVGLGDSFRDPVTVADAAQDALDRLTQQTSSLEALLED